MIKKEKTKNKPVKNQKKLKSTGRDSDRAKSYAMRRFINPTETKKQSMIMCGYSERTNANQIETQPGFQNAIEELKANAKKAKCSPTDQLSFFQKMRDNKKIAPTPRIESGKEINRMLGYKSPEVIEVQQSHTQNVAVLVGMIRQSDGVSIGELIASAKRQDISNKCKVRDAND